MTALFVLSSPCVWYSATMNEPTERIPLQRRQLVIVSMLLSREIIEFTVCWCAAVSCYPAQGQAHARADRACASVSMIVARTARTVLVRVVRTRCAVLRWYVCGVELVALGARSLGALLGERVVLVPVRTSTLFGARRTLSRRALRLLRRGARVLRFVLGARCGLGHSVVLLAVGALAALHETRQDKRNKHAAQYS